MDKDPNIKYLKEEAALKNDLLKDATELIKRLQSLLADKDERIKQLEEALQGFLDGTTKEFAEINGFDIQRNNAEQALQPTSEKVKEDREEENE